MPSRRQPASIHDIVTDEAGRPQRAPPLRRLRAPIRPRPGPPARDHAAKRFADGSAEDLVDTLTVPWRAAPSLGEDRVVLAPRGDRRSSCEDDPRSAAAGTTRRSASRSRSTNVSASPFEGLLGVEFAMMLLGGGHNPAAFHEVGGRRIAHDEALVAGAVTSLRAGNDHLGVTVETTTRSSRVDAWISPIETVSNSEAGFELVYQGSCVLLHRQVELAPGASATIRGRAAGDGRRRTTPSRRRPPRDPRPARGPRPLLPAVAGRPVDRPGARRSRPRRRSTTGTPASTRSATGRTRSAATSTRISWDLGPTLASWLAAEDPTTLAGFAAAASGGNAIAQAFHHTILPLASAADRRTEIRWGHARLRAAVRAAAERALAAGDRGRPRDAPRSPPRRASTSTILAPWQAADDDRHAAGRTASSWAAGASIVVAFYDARAVGGGLVRAGGDVRRRPLRPRAGRAASARRPATPGDDRRPAARPDRDRRRAVRPPPAVPRPVPAAARRPRRRGRRASRVRRRVAGRRARRGRRPAPPDARRSSSGRRGAATTASPAGRPSARTRSTAAGRVRSGRRSSGWPRRSTWHGALVRRRRATRPLGRCATRTSTWSSARPSRTRSQPIAWPALAAAERARALELLEAQRWRLAMFASDGWFWDDPIRPETKQILRSAARAVRIVDGELGTAPRGPLRRRPRPLHLAVARPERRRDLPGRPGGGRPAGPGLRRALRRIL